jgi:uncharacterized integral membrane protein (TIGR00697 family)
MATSVDGLAVGVGCTLSLLREFHGLRIARQGIYAGLGGIALSSLLALQMMNFTSVESSLYKQSFEALWLPSPRIFAASLFAFFVSDRLEIQWLGWLQKRWEGGYFIGRYLLCQIGAQLVDTVLFTWLGLTGILSDLTEIAIVAFCVKLLSIAVSAIVLWVLPKSWRAESYAQV